jgi:hypothetical protein
VILREVFLDAEGHPVPAGDPAAVTIEVEVRYDDGRVVRTYATA